MVKKAVSLRNFFGTQQFFCILSLNTKIKVFGSSKIFMNAVSRKCNELGLLKSLTYSFTVPKLYLFKVHYINHREFVRQGMFK